MNTETKKKWVKPNIRLPLGVIIAICTLPVVLTGLFYALRSSQNVMDWVVTRVSSHIRGFLGLLSSIYPFSVTEVLFAVAVVWLIYYIIKTIKVTVRRRGKLKILLKRMLPVFVVAFYVWGLFYWLWNSGYYAPGFADKNGFTGGGVSVHDLTAVTRSFADKANELSPLVKRDEDGRYIEDRREVFAASTEVYRVIASDFPGLNGRLYTPKPMLFSWLMSRTGYTGMYFALTGEANINTMTPGAFLPATVAHEHAHQLGVFAEDEASFIGIVACVTSEYTVFEYAGYLSGLTYLLSALHDVDEEAWTEICFGLSDEVMRDWNDSSYFWASQKKVETGIDFLDNLLTSITVGVSDAVDSVYDGFLKSQNQDLGIQSYGACVDLLVEYFKAQSAAR